ncbi:BREX-1 system adenine-specific DNA-methyltransferase PglX [Acidaminococcus provencensis]|uniref:BREX-1 system adenine-specific DNA-methyltransferase PglX n=1 Tax=Acidaminococcus provencensis TaxID=2058289 RepID=UPI0022E2CBC9|nr:BREX-1 system adenine-specific DNA-methyltransferase PglX [Acidaminococcus provencensis]
MNKNAIKKYAVWARNELIERVSQKADQYEISADADPNADSAHGVLLTPAEKKQRASLISKVKEKGMDQVMEEVAYTWFNRFAALRFMEVNNYLPSRVRVFTDEKGAFKPEILSEAIHLELDGLNMEKVYALKDANDNEAIFKYLIITQCNALSSVLPGMFQKIADYTELLFPDNLLREGSVIEQMVTTIPEDDWKDQVQIIGWLYQYYNTEPKDKVFADLKKNKKITKDKIPAATQLFTPDWIVRYMVENSLGRLWIEGHPNDELKANWKYYLDDAKQEPEVQKQLDEIHREYSALTPEDILCVDPCMGSGHIICYLFDVLMQIYEAYGYTARDAVSSIVRNNLYGLDIDDRASQLAYFSVMMKACQYDRRFLSRGIQPHVYAIRESNGFDPHMIDSFTDGHKELKTAINSLISDLHDAKEYGSILNVTPVDFQALYSRFDEIRSENPNMYTYQILDELLPFVQMAEAMAQKYHVVVTNPPYMGSSGMSGKLSEFIKANYPDSKSDLFAVFIERCGQMVRKNYYKAMITQHAWMFLSSFEKLRQKMLQKTIVNMAHLGARAFEEIGGEVVQTTSFVLSNNSIKNYKGVFCRLIEPNTQQGKEDLFLSGDCRYESSQDNFSKIPGSPLAYWASENLLKDFSSGRLVSEFASPRQGMSTCDVSRFTRLWFEVSICRSNIFHPENKGKWIRYNKGGNFRKWYGNREYLVDWSKNGDVLLSNGAVLRNRDEYFKPFIAWTKISSAGTGFRKFEENFLFDGAGGSLFNKNNGVEDYYLLGMLNSKVDTLVLNLISPTLNFNENHIGSIPVILCKDSTVRNEINNLVDYNIQLSKFDWDSFETSWDFQKHPLIRKTTTIADAFKQWQSECNDRFNQLKSNEEELNRIFIDIYDLQDELASEEDDKDVTVRKADLGRDIRSFISYAVGCMMGRYSLDFDGLAYAGGDWDASKYKTFIPDKDAIIPITDDEYFTDDIVGRFVEFVKTVYGADTLEENLKFIADALDEKGATSREAIRNYFLNDFYKDHLKTYQKRPIYWLFDSGKKNGFKCLVYMHRYQPDTIARIRTDYVHEQQARYRTAISSLERQINGASTSERVRLNKQLTKLRDQAEETRLYEEKIHHLADQMIKIDLDDGVKHNYAIFQDVLAKIK